MLLPAALVDATISEERLIGELKELCLDKLAIRVDSAYQDLFETGILDSTNMVRLLLHLEEQFGLRFAIEEIGAESFRSIDMIAKLVANRLNAGQNGVPHVVTANGIHPESDDTVTVIKALFLDKMNIKVESVKADLFQTGVFDSMTLVEFILHLEEHFELRFPMQELELDSILSIEKLADLVAAGKRAAAAGRGL